MNWKGCGPKRKYTLKRDEMIYVPLTQTLQQLLQSDFVRYQVNLTSIFVYNDHIHMLILPLHNNEITLHTKHIVQNHRNGMHTFKEFHTHILKQLIPTLSLCQVS